MKHTHRNPIILTLSGLAIVAGSFIAPAGLVAAGDLDGNGTVDPPDFVMPDETGTAATEWDNTAQVPWRHGPVVVANEDGDAANTSVPLGWRKVPLEWD